MYKLKSLFLPLAFAALLTLFYSLSGVHTPAGYADSDELITMAYFNAVAHPPGFPLLIYITHLTMKLFFLISPVAVANTLAGFFQALAVVIVFHLMRLILTQTVSKPSVRIINWSSFAVAGVLAFSYLWWTYASIFEMVSFTNLITVLTLWAAFRWYTAKPFKIDRYFWLTWISAGVLLGHYQLGILLFPGLLLMVVFKCIAAKLKIFPSIKYITLGVFLLSVTFIIVNLPLWIQNTASSPVSWNFPQTINGWLGHIARQDYVGIDPESTARFDTAFPLPANFDTASYRSILQFLTYINGHFGVLIVLIALTGFIVVWKYNRKMGMLLSLFFLLSGMFLAAYLKAVDITFEPSLILGIVQRQYFIGEITFILFFGIGFYYLLKKIHWVPPVIISLGLIGFEIYFNHSILTVRSSRLLSSDIARTRLAQASPDALIICTNDIDCYSLFYESAVNHTRPDVVILSHSGSYNQKFIQNNPQLYPYPDQEIPDYMAQLVAFNVPKRPVYLTSGVGFYPEYIGLETGPFYLEPQGLLLKISTVFPKIINPYQLPDNLRPKTSLDPRDEYGKGIVEVLANNQAYAGYLSLLYHNTAVAGLYLNHALTLDPDNTQAAELLNHLDQYAQDLAAAPKTYSADNLIKEAKTWEEKGDYESAETLLRYASYLEPANVSPLDELINFYQKTGHTQKAEIIITHKRILKQ